MKNLIKAFIEAQKEMADAKKDAKNPFFKSLYADLNAVREACIPVLNKHNIAVLQPIIQKDGKSYVRTILMHDTGESLESDVEIIFGKTNDAQAQGSGITYARRYGLQSLVNIGAADDDGNAAVQPAKPFAKLNNVADDEEMQRLKSEKKEADAVAKRKAAEEFFAKIKKELEACTTLTEISAIKTTNEKMIKALEKHPDLSKLLEETIEDIVNGLNDGVPM